MDTQEVDELAKEFNGYSLKTGIIALSLIATATAVFFTILFVIMTFI